MHGAPYMRQAFFDIERIIIHMGIARVPSRIQGPHILILADIVTECSVHRIYSAEHDCARRVPMTVIILVVRAVAIVRIPWLSVAVSIRSVQGSEALIVLEHRILALLRPDTCRNSSCRDVLITASGLPCIVQYRLPFRIMVKTDLRRSVF